jgi:RIO-like serine/threonine protein kinase
MKTTLDLSVLRALARLSRMRKGGDLEALALRSGGSIEDVRGALGRLSRAALVDRSQGGLRLTMAGLAWAVASGAAAAPRRRERAVRRQAA